MILYSLLLTSPVLVVIIWMIWSRWKEYNNIQDKRQAEFSFKPLARGDIGFSYKPAQISDQKFSVLIGLPLIMMGLFAIIAAHIESKWRIVLLILPCLLFLYNYFKMNVGAINRKREAIGVNSFFNCEKITEICSGLFSDNPTCLFFKYIIHQTGELGNFERLIAAVLSNDETIVLRVVRRKDERGKWSFTIKMNPEIIDDREITNKILPLRERIKRMLNPDYNDFMALIAYLLIWLILAVLLVGPFFLNYKLWLALLCCYTLIGWFLLLIKRHQDYPDVFIKVYTFLGRLLNLLFNLTGPILAFLIGMILIMGLAVILAIIIYGVSWIITEGGIGLNINYMVFLCVASISLTSVYANGIIQRLFEKLDIFRNFTDKSMTSPMLGMIEYVFQKENINCVIYTVYLIFITLSTFGLYLSDSHDYLINEGIDSAVIKAFLIHIAFTNMMTRKKELKIDTKGFMEYVIKILEQK